MVIKIARFIASVVLVLSIPIALISSNLRWLALSPAQYEAGHVKYAVANAMGVTQGEIRSASQAIIEYLQSRPDSLPTLLNQHGIDPSFFSERDLLHFIDVHGLIQLVFQAQLYSLVLTVVCIVALALLYGRGRDEEVASRILWGGGLTAATLVLMGLVFLIDFDTVFLQFHYIAFTNDFWRLDPQIDRLILMFPPDFFYDMTLQAAAQSLVQAVIIVVVGAAFLVVKRRWAGRPTTGYR